MTELQTVLVTGGAGYIGSHTCKALAASGFIPVTIDNLSSGHADLVRWGPLIRSDIRDVTAVTKVILEYRPVAVVHFAAKAYVGESLEEPAKYYETNISGTISLAAAMRQTSLNKIVFSSTCATFGVPDASEISEKSTQNPINPYGFTKLAVERLLSDYDFAYGLQSVILRYFNAAGCDEAGDTGELHFPETHIIPLSILASMHHIPPIVLLGDNFDTADGTAVRDYVHVSDLASAHVAALKYILEQGRSTSFNIGTGKGTSVREIFKSVERVTGRAVPYKRGSRRQGDPPLLVADPRKALSELGWTPRHTCIDEIVRTAARWFARPDILKRLLQEI